MGSGFLLLDLKVDRDLPFLSQSDVCGDSRARSRSRLCQAAACAHGLNQDRVRGKGPNEAKEITTE